MSKRVVVTGAAGGIGAAAVRRLRARGAQVVGLDLSTDDDGIVKCDVSDQASVEAAVGSALEGLGGLDVLINNAGLGDPQSAGEPPDERARTVIDVNLLGPWRVASACLEPLRESGGRVVNVASGLAHLTVPFAPAYCMSKRGLIAYSDALRLEHGDQLTVTTVYVGFVDTGIHARSEEEGVRLKGAVPEESVEEAAETLVKAALGRPARELATTRRGAVYYALASRAPGRVLDRIVTARVRQLNRRGHFEKADMARGYLARVD